MDVAVAEGGLDAALRTDALPVGGRKLTHLQALRAIAASLVVLAHAVDALGERRLIAKRSLSWLTNCGYFGVGIFFVISGFIIYRTGAPAFGNWRLVGRFVTKRLIRILPIYWLASLLFVAISPHRGDFSALDMLFSALLLPHYVDSVGNMHPLLGQGWTLQYEMLFYTLFSLSLLCNPARGRLAIFTVIAVLVVMAALLPGSWDAPQPAPVWEYWGRPIILLFLLGVGIGVVEARANGRIVVPFAMPLLALLTAAWLVYSWFVLQGSEDHLLFPSVLGVWLLGAAMVWVCVFGRGWQRGDVERLAQLLGDASYSVYLFHAFVLSALLRLGVQDISPVLFVVGTIVVANLLGAFIYAVIERPVLGVLRTILVGSDPRPTAAATKTRA